MAYHYLQRESQEQLTNELYDLIKDHEEIVIVCVGTDRSTGDSLGPLVGERLQHAPLCNTTVYGNLEYPVHALNVADVSKKITTHHPEAFVLAVDAVLGHAQNVGKVYLKKEPLKPGAGVSKELPTIGDATIGGIVNVGGLMEIAVLQSTRLFVVMRIAELIAISIIEAISKKREKPIR